MRLQHGVISLSKQLKKKVNELCFAVVVFCFLFPQKVLKSGFESPVDLLVGTPGTLLEFLERGKG